MLSWEGVTRHIYSPRGTEGTDRPDKWFLPKTSWVDQWICWGYLQMYGWLKVGVPLKSTRLSQPSISYAPPRPHAASWWQSDDTSREREWWLSLFDEGSNSLFTSVSWPRWLLVALTFLPWLLAKRVYSHHSNYFMTTYVNVSPGGNSSTTTAPDFWLFFSLLAKACPSKMCWVPSCHPPYINTGLLFWPVHS